MTDIQENKENSEVTKQPEPKNREKRERGGIFRPVREQVENVGEVNGSLFKVFFVELFDSIKFLVLYLYGKYKERNKNKNNNS